MINWHKAIEGSELPTDGRNVIVRAVNGDTSWLAYDYFDTKIDDWSCHKREDDCIVTHWVDLSDIPLPEDI